MLQRKKVLNTFQTDYSLFVGDFSLFLGKEGVITTSMFTSYRLLEYSQVITGKSLYADDFPCSFCNRCAIILIYLEKTNVFVALIIADDLIEAIPIRGKMRF